MYAYTRPEDKIARSSSPPEELPGVIDLVAEDLQVRRGYGEEKYGVVLKPFDGSDPLAEAYQEALDLVIYLRQALHERDHSRD